MTTIDPIASILSARPTFTVVLGHKPDVPTLRATSV